MFEETYNPHQTLLKCSKWLLAKVQRRTTLSEYTPTPYTLIMFLLHARSRNVPSHMSPHSSENHRTFLCVKIEVTSLTLKCPAELATHEMRL